MISAARVEAMQRDLVAAATDVLWQRQGHRRVLDLGDEPAVRRTLRTLPGTVVVVSAAEDFTSFAPALPFKDRIFDVTYAYRLFERCDVDAVRRMVSEAARVTRQRLVIGLSTGLRYDHQIVTGRDDGDERLHQFPQVMFESVLRECGFSHVAVTRFRMSPDALVVAERGEDLAC